MNQDQQGPATSSSDVSTNNIRANQPAPRATPQECVRFQLPTELNDDDFFDTLYKEVLHNVGKAGSSTTASRWSRGDGEVSLSEVGDCTSRLHPQCVLTSSSFSSPDNNAAPGSASPAVGRKGMHLGLTGGQKLSGDYYRCGALQ